MASEPRTRVARDRAEEALVRFALLTSNHTADFVVIGGLNPDFLAPQAPHPHLGTTDVDLLFELGFVYERDELDFGWLDDALTSGGFKAAASAAGWQWKGHLGDAVVRLDLLCDVHDSQGQTISLPGAAEAAAQNLQGPAVALIDPVERALSVSDTVRADFPDAPPHVHLRFASLGGYVAAKSAAFLAREQSKDAYDLAFVLMYNDGGPRAAAHAIATMDVPSHIPPVEDTVRAAILRLAEPPWTSVVVRQLRNAGDDSDENQLLADVTVSANRFLTSLSRSA